MACIESVPLSYKGPMPLLNDLLVKPLGEDQSPRENLTRGNAIQPSQEAIQRSIRYVAETQSPV